MFTIGLLILLCKDNVQLFIQSDTRGGVNWQCHQVNLKISSVKLS